MDILGMLLSSRNFAYAYTGNLQPMHALNELTEAQTALLRFVVDLFDEKSYSKP